jgi:flavodoxin I
MDKIGIFYGSTTGNTEAVAGDIAEQLGGAEVHDIGETPVAKMDEYDVLVLGSSTWGDGDVQDDWYDALDDLGRLDLSGKKVALFGTGDAEIYEDTFCDAIGILYERLSSSNADFIGAWPLDGYLHTESRAEKDGVFVGLPLDEDNQDDLTVDRIKEWTAKLQAEIG